MNNNQQQFFDALIAIDRVKAREMLISQKDEVPPLKQVNDLIIPALEKLGYLWEQSEAALSQVYMSGRICEELVDEILPPRSPERIDQPKMAIAVLDDYHFLGKRIVYSVLRANGYELKDYGRQTVDELIVNVSGDDIKILLISFFLPISLSKT